VDMTLYSPGGQFEDETGTVLGLNTFLFMIREGLTPRLSLSADNSFLGSRSAGRSCTPSKSVPPI